MFNKINKKAVDKNNSKVNEEINSHKPGVETPKVSKTDRARDISGNLLAIAGNLSLVIAGIGAATILLEALVSFIGINALITITLLAGLGIAAMFAGSKLAINIWDLGV